MSGPIDLLSLASPTVVMAPARLYAALRDDAGTTSPPRFLTVQQNFSMSGLYTLNVRYRFRNGLAFQEGRGTC